MAVESHKLNELGKEIELLNSTKAERGPGEMAQWERALTAPLEDLGSVFQHPHGGSL